MMKIKKSEYLNLDKINASAFYELKANIQFASREQGSKIIMISSAEKNDGRSTTAAYLALALAESGKKTILIDCDLRNSNIHNMFGLENDKGLVDFLSGVIDFKDAVKATKQNNLAIVTSGAVTSNYAELLVSSKFNDFLEKLKEDFDYIIIDTPPITESSDAQALSKYADGSVLVVRDGQTERKTAIKAKDILKKANANIIGVFLNKTN